MSDNWRDYRWRCPHCDNQRLRLDAAERHLRVHHPDCLSCQGEKLLLHAIITGDQDHWMDGVLYRGKTSRA